LATDWVSARVSERGLVDLAGGWYAKVPIVGERESGSSRDGDGE